MNNKLLIAATVLSFAALAGAQSGNTKSAGSAARMDQGFKIAPITPKVPTSWKPVARVNGTVLVERDLLREMYTIFPYAQQHNGFPKDLKPEIRKGALEMIIFDELVYQEAKRRNLAVPESQMTGAESELRKQFQNKAAYEQFLKSEFRGSRQYLREKIRRSLLIEALLKIEVANKAKVTAAEARTYYNQNPNRFKHDDRFKVQTISIIPPQNANPEVLKEARKRAEDALRQAKATRSYREFGLLAEKVSDDDWHVNMGDRKEVEAATLPPPLVQAARKMKVGEVSDLLQFGPNFTLFRLNGHLPPGRDEFATVKSQLTSELQKAKYNKLRSELHARLRKTAKIEVL
jgi:parvulin-like peptidyl-prolyl isomerase